MLSAQPKLADLRALINKIDDFPVSAREVTNIAIRSGAKRAVVDFYRAFPRDTVFDDQEELTARSEQVEMLNEESDQPPEILTSAEED